ncbi:PAS domain-containing protein [Sphingomonas phyllosphaerae]|uniref:sensor histidine kinase n=1 Tax=Sphingomonas phyllosphaerae TaxID=257003 RepID=UPI0003B3CD35
MSAPLCPADAAPATIAGAGPIDERQRRATIDAYNLVALRRAAALKQITDFAARLCEAEIALVSLVEEDEQSFLSATGTDLDGTPRAMSFCAYAMWQDDIMVVPDATQDPRFADNPLLVDPGVRFYAGAPLVTEEGVPLGALCVLGTSPRPAGLTALQLGGLRVLGAAVMARVHGSRDHAVSQVARREAEDSETRFRILADTMPQMVWSTLPDGYHDYYNARWYAFTGTPEGSTDGEAWNGMFHADDQERAWAAWRHALGTGEPYQIEYRLRHHDGTYRWVLGRALPIRDAAGTITRWFGTCTDIHQQRLAMEEREIVSQELSHRIKNIFSVVAGLVHLTGRTHPPLAGLLGELRQRITALGRAHDFVRPHSDQSRPSVRQDSLHGLLEELFIPYQSRSGERFTIKGDNVVVDDRAATPLALIFHELATNASKYGALSSIDGRVTMIVTDTGRDVVLLWHEQGGPTLHDAPTQHGFGSQLIEMSAKRQLGGTLVREWHADGLRVEVRVPREAFSRLATT